jgi:transposase
MLRPIDRSRRDDPLYPGATRTLRACIDPKHLLIRIDTALDLASYAEPLQAAYRAGGRPAIHPEIVLRALLLGGLYHVGSDRQLCERIAENLAWRWFCHLTLDDAVFDHSTLTVFLERVGSQTLTQVLDRLTEALHAAKLLSPRAYLDASLIPAAASRRDLPPREPSDDPLTYEPATNTWEERVAPPNPDGAPPQLELRRYQDAEGRLTLSTSDPDARWRTQGNRSVLGYKEQVLADRSGFILARRTTPADVSDAEGALPLFEHLVVQVKSVTADSGYRAGVLRRVLRQLDIAAYIPVDCNQDAGVPVGFTDHYDHIICPEGKRLLPSGFPDAEGSIRYTARPADCRECALRDTCVSPSRRTKALWASTYRLELRQAERINQTVRYAREQRRRQTVSEGVFAHLDHLGGKRARVRGLERMNQRGVLLALAHNIKKAMTKRRFWPREAGTGAVIVPSPSMHVSPRLLSVRLMVLC